MLNLSGAATATRERDNYHFAQWPVLIRHCSVPKRAHPLQHVFNAIQRRDCARDCAKTEGSSDDGGWERRYHEHSEQNQDTGMFG